MSDALPRGPGQQAKEQRDSVQVFVCAHNLTLEKTYPSWKPWRAKQINAEQLWICTLEASDEGRKAVKDKPLKPVKRRA